MKLADKMGLPRRVKRYRDGSIREDPSEVRSVPSKHMAPIPPEPFTRAELIAGLRTRLQGAAEQYAFTLMGIAEEELAVCGRQGSNDLFMQLKPEGLPTPEEYRVWVQTKLNHNTQGVTK